MPATARESGIDESHDLCDVVLGADGLHRIVPTRSHEFREFQIEPLSVGGREDDVHVLDRVLCM